MMINYCKRLRSHSDKTIIEWFLGTVPTLKNILLEFAISTLRPAAVRLILQILAKYFQVYTSKSFNNCIILYGSNAHGFLQALLFFFQNNLCVSELSWPTGIYLLEKVPALKSFIL